MIDLLRPHIDTNPVARHLFLRIAKAAFFCEATNACIEEGMSFKEARLTAKNALRNTSRRFFFEQHG